MTTGTDLSACGQFLLRFYQALDEGRFAVVAATFCEDGEWHRNGQILIGPAQVQAVYAGRDPDLRTRHVVSNVLLDPQQGQVDFSLYITVFAGRAPPGKLPVVQGPSMVLTSHGILLPHGAGWKIRKKTTTRQFLIEAGQPGTGKP